MRNSLYAALPVFAQNAVCTAAGYWRYRARFNSFYDETIAKWEQSVSWPVEKLHALQRERLDRVIRRAREHVPYYRDLEPPSEARDPLEAMRRTLASIPPLEKRTYRDDPTAFLARDVPRHRLKRGRTSGTTGTALPLWHTPQGLAEEYASVWRMRLSCGVERLDPNLTFTGSMIVPFHQTRPPFWRTNAHSGQTLFSIYHMKPANLPSYVDAVHGIRAKYVQGYPSSIHLMARALLDAGRPLPPGRLAAVFTSSESLLAFQRETIEKAFGAPVRDRYGVSEFTVSMTECGEQRLHTDMEFGVVEVEPVERTEDSVTGPLLITGLAYHATPLIRYRIGDVGTHSTRPCPCGRPGEVFLKVDGRIEDYVVTPDGRMVGRLDHIFKEQYDVAEAQILQEDAHAIEVLVVPGETWNEASQNRLLKEIRSRLGDEIEIEVRMVNDIAREPNGKFRAVKSRIGRIRA